MNLHLHQTYHDKPTPLTIMKTLFISLLLATGTMHSLFGQVQDSPMAKASEFYSALSKQIRYPAASRDANKVAKAYVFFSVDETGQIANVLVLNATSVDAPFVDELTRVLTALPPQARSYAGSYVLPVQFQLEGNNKQIAPTDENSAFLNFLKDKSLLSEIVVVGYAKI